MRGWRVLTVLSFIIIIALVATACNPFGNQSQNQQQLVQVTKGDLIIKANGSGKVGVDLDATPSFSTGGKIIKLNVKEGDKVEKGAVLAQFETDNLELSLSQAKLAEAQAQTAVVQAQVAQTQSQSAITQAETSLATAQFNLDRTQAVSDIKDEITKLQWKIQMAELRVQETLVISQHDAADYWSQQIVSYQKDLDKQNTKLTDLLDKDEYQGQGALTYNIMGQTYDRLTVEDVRMKQLQVKSAQQAVDEATQNLELAKQNIEQAQQSLEQATKAAGVAEKNLQDATVIAPVAGTAVRVDVKEGDILPASSISPSTPIYLIDLNSIQVAAQIDEIDIAGVKLGQKVIISLDSAPGIQYQGSVKSISMVPVANPQNSGVVVYEVKIGFANPPPPEVKPGMSATVDIVTVEHQGVLLISNRAIKEDNQGNSVVEVMVNQKIETRPVKIGISDGVNTEITSGLNQGDTVVITRATQSTSLFGQ
jgi:macrolide-specific efflux system membrane fusion protein